MAIPVLSHESVEQALRELSPELSAIKNSPHDSAKYDLLWQGERFPPKVVVSRAVEIEHGYSFPEAEFSGGECAGQANAVLRDLGFHIVSKIANDVALPLQLYGRYGRKEVYATQGIAYDQQQQHLNRGLSPRNPDRGYMIFVTLNKEDLDPAHDCADELFADNLIWVSIRDVTLRDPDYKDLANSEVRTSLFVRSQPREEFVYLGEAHTQDVEAISDSKTGKPQLRFIGDVRLCDLGECANHTAAPAAIAVFAERCLGCS